MAEDMYTITCPDRPDSKDGPHTLVQVARLLASFARVTPDWEGHCPGPHTIELVEDYEDAER
jgi:hypothetical protein